MSQQNETPSAESLKKITAPILETAKSFVIDSPMMYEMAGDELKTIKGKAKELEERRKAITQPMDAAKKSVMDLFRSPLDMLEQAETAIKRSMLNYQNEQRRIAAEQQRIADEAAAAERKRMADASKAAEQTGDTGTAVMLATAAEMVTAPVVATPEPAKIRGISTSTRWSAEVSDKTAYIKHVLEHPELIDTIQIDMKPLNQMATALKDKLNIPGIRAVSSETMSARA